MLVLILYTDILLEKKFLKSKLNIIEKILLSIFDSDIL